MGKGIDYGMGRTNVDRETGIRFGVISQNEVVQAWSDESESVYPDPEPCDCETCGGLGTIEDDSGTKSDCDDCDGTGSVPSEPSDFDEPLGFEYEGQGYRASSGTDGDIFITKSPYYTRAAFCSPCAPGAVYLMSPHDEGEKGYCFGHDWFEDGVAPYPVYRVEDDSVVEPSAK